jgi:hypothetical protein
MVEELVREFVPEALAAGLDFSGLQRVNPKFHTGRRSGRRREGDVIWRLPTREGADIYLYLLMEFQSKSEWWMAVRAQVYEGLLWQQVIDEKKLLAGARLPPLLLLVLYNGVRRWDAPTSTRELIALSPDSALWPWQPQTRYYLLGRACRRACRGTRQRKSRGKGGSTSVPSGRKIRCGDTLLTQANPRRRANHN